jgi:large subunit ribosomal protein L47
MQALVRLARRTALSPAFGAAAGVRESAVGWTARGIAGSTAARSNEGLNAFLDPIRFLPEDKQKDEVSGREWEARELRLKSFEDLHGLWYVLLKEKNMLSTEKYVARANRVRMRAAQRIGQVRRSMAKIKLVLSERAIEDAGDDEATRRRFMRIINAK